MLESTEVESIDKADKRWNLARRRVRAHTILKRFWARDAGQFPQAGAPSVCTIDFSADSNQRTNYMAQVLVATIRHEEPALPPSSAKE